MSVSGIETVERKDAVLQFNQVFSIVLEHTQLSEDLDRVALMSKLMSAGPRL